MATRPPHVQRRAARRRDMRALVRERRGASVIEFAIVLAPVIALIVAIVQTALVFFAQQNLESSAERTARQLVTGSAQRASMTSTNFGKAACANLPAFMKCANLMIDVQNVSSFSAVSTAAPKLTFDANGNVTNAWAFSPGGPGSIVVMRMMYRLPVVPAPLGFDLSNMGNGQRLLIATSVFKTEPYGS